MVSFFDQNKILRNLTQGDPLKFRERRKQQLELEKKQDHVFSSWISTQEDKKRLQNESVKLIQSIVRRFLAKNELRKRRMRNEIAAKWSITSVFKFYCDLQVMPFYSFCFVTIFIPTIFP